MSTDQGRFTWFEQMSDDPTKALRFYTEVLPWTIESFPMGDESYPMIKAGEAMIGGFATLQGGAEHPHWISYVTVADVDERAKAVVDAGGKTLMDAFDVPTIGRMQPVADPQGGVFFLFRGAGEAMPEAKGVGTFNWNELWTSDAKAAVAFYEKVLGYTRKEMDMPMGTYYVLEQQGVPRAGIMQSPSKDIPTHWLPYVEVADLDGTLKRIGRNGGKSEGDPMEIPGVGRFAFVRDPQGARLGLITPAAKS